MITVGDVREYLNGLPDDADGLPVLGFDPDNGDVFNAVSIHFRDGTDDNALLIGLSIKE